MGEWRRADGISLAAAWLPFICLHLACSTVSHSVKIFHWIRRESIELYAPDTRISSFSAPVFSSRLLSCYRGARLRPDARDPPLIRLVAETTRGPVKASTSAAFSRSPPFIRPFFYVFSPLRCSSTTLSLVSSMTAGQASFTFLTRRSCSTFGPDVC